MKKKILIFFSLCVLTICLLALTVSASNYIDVSNFEFSAQQSCEVYTYTNKYSVNNSDFVSAENETFGIIEIVNPITSATARGFMNIEWWCEYFTQQNVVDLNSFNEAVSYLADNNYIDTDNNGTSLYFCLVTFSPDYFATYQQYLNVKTYEDGISEGRELGISEYKASTEYATAISEAKIEGISEYKASTEYATAISEAKIEGIEYYKSSIEYDSILKSKYKLGESEGVANYLKSDDYTNALDAEYDAGYNQGVSDTESTSSSSGTGALFSVLAIVLVVLAGFYIYKSTSRRRRR